MATEKVYQKKIKDITVEQGTYTPADDFIIEQAAAVLAQIDIARKELNKAGHIQEFSTGAKQIAPELNSWRGLLNDFQRYADLLGLSPKSRARMGVETKPAEEKQDPFKLRPVMAKKAK